MNPLLIIYNKKILIIYYDEKNKKGNKIYKYIKIS